MHLLVWSPSLWRPLATAAEVFVPSTKVEANHLSDWEAYYDAASRAIRTRTASTKWRATGRA